MSRADISAGKAHVELYVKNSKFVKGLNRASKQLGSFGKNIAQIGATFIAAGTAVTGSLVAATVQFAAVGDQLDKMRKRTGFTAEALSGLGFAAEQSGASMDQLDRSLAAMARFSLMAERGLATATDTLDMLGVSLADFRSAKPDERFKLLADAISNVEDPTVRAGLALQVFGRNGRELLPMLEGGRASIEALEREARELGLTLSEEDATAAAELTDMMNRLKRSVQAVTISVGRELTPMLTEVQGRLVTIAKSVGDWVRENGHAVRAAMNLGVTLTGLGAAITGAGLAFIGVAKTLGAISFLLTTLTNPIGLITIAIAGLATYWFNFTEQGQRALSALVKAFQNAWHFMKPIITGISQALAEGDFKLAAEIAAAAIEVAFLRAFKVVRDNFVELASEMTGIMTDIAKALQGNPIAIARAAGRIAGRMQAEGALSGDLTKAESRLSGKLAEAAAPGRTRAAGKSRAAEIKSVRDDTSRMTDIDETVRQQNAAMLAEETAMRKRIIEHQKKEVNDKLDAQRIARLQQVQAEEELKARQAIASALSREAAIKERLEKDLKQRDPSKRPSGAEAAQTLTRAAQERQFAIEEARLEQRRSLEEAAEREKQDRERRDALMGAPANAARMNASQLQALERRRAEATGGLMKGADREVTSLLERQLAFQQKIIEELRLGRAVFE